MKALALLVLAGCGSPASQVPKPPASPIGPTTCASHRVHGVINDADGKAVGKTQVSVVGSDGQDDATTDDDGRFDITAAGTRDRFVVFYGDGSVTRKLDATSCDELIKVRVSESNTTPLTL
jgi:hypothetical protein